MTYLLAVLGAIALYFLVVMPWQRRREESLDLDPRLRRARDGTPTPPSPSSMAEEVPEPETVESVLSDAEKRDLFGDEGDEPEEEGGPPAWPTEAPSPSDLEPILAVHTADGSLATLLMLELQSEGIAYQDLGDVWASHRILVPRLYEKETRRILERLRRDMEPRADRED